MLCEKLSDTHLCSTELIPSKATAAVSLHVPGRLEYTEPPPIGHDERVKKKEEHEAVSQQEMS